MIYLPATLCLNGHIISSSKQNYSKFCKACGESTISKCEYCFSFIQGDYDNEFIGFDSFEKPYYCYECGEPYPWTSKLIEMAIEILFLDEDLSAKHKSIIKNAFQI